MLDKATAYLDSNLHHQWRTRSLLVASASLYETRPELYDPALRYDGQARAAAWNALTDTTDPNVDPAVYRHVDRRIDAVKDTVDFLLNTYYEWAITPPALMAVLDAANPSWLSGHRYAAALMLIGPSADEARAWATHGTAPTMDEALLMVALRHRQIPSTNTPKEPR